MTTKAPAKSIRFGAVEAAVWENEGRNGLFYSVTFKRSYKDGEDWKDAVSFGERDCVALARAALEANAFITAKLRETALEKGAGEPPLEEKGKRGKKNAA